LARLAQPSSKLSRSSQEAPTRFPQASLQDFPESYARILAMAFMRLCPMTASCVTETQRDLSRSEARAETRARRVMKDKKEMKRETATKRGNDHIG
jgi:hypothetical protein